MIIAVSNIALKERRKSTTRHMFSQSRQSIMAAIAIPNETMLNELQAFWYQIRGADH